MSSTPKTTPKKLRGGPTIAVDNQILRWREKLAVEGIKLGKGMAYQERDNRRQRKARETDTVEKLKTKKWF